MSQITIGRLHKLECSSSAEYEGFTIGENIQTKVLKVSQGKTPLIQDVVIDKEKTWIELTRRKEHMSRAGNNLDEATLSKTLLSFDDLKQGKQYDAMITDVNYAYSQPLQITLSPFIKSYVSFDNIVEPETLISEGSSYLQQFKEGASIKVYFN